jgi:hypothetical protein
MLSEPIATPSAKHQGFLHLFLKASSNAESRKTKERLGLLGFDRRDGVHRLGNLIDEPLSLRT